MQLVLSLFSGVGLLDKAFREAGFCVVSAGDLILGQDIRDFTGVKNKFVGIIGGSPCQDFSSLKRVKTNYSLDMLYEFLRVVSECEPDWYLLENVKGVPDVTELLNNNVTHLDKINVTLLLNYSHQRIDINQAWYDDYSRLRHIQFCTKDYVYLDIPRGNSKNVIGGCALASDDRSFKELCHIQGLPDDFDLTDFTVKGKKKLIGNGVPLSIGRVLADEVLRVTVPGYKDVTLQRNISPVKCDKICVTQQDKNKRHEYTLPKEYLNSGFYCVDRRCACGCGRIVKGRKLYYDFSCRKRAQRKRDKILSL